MAGVEYIQKRLYSEIEKYDDESGVLLDFSHDDFADLRSLEDHISLGNKVMEEHGVMAITSYCSKELLASLGLSFIRPLVQQKILEKLGDEEKLKTAIYIKGQLPIPICDNTKTDDEKFDVKRQLVGVVEPIRSAILLWWIQMDMEKIDQVTAKWVLCEVAEELGRHLFNLGPGRLAHTLTANGEVPVSYEILTDERMAGRMGTSFKNFGHSGYWKAIKERGVKNVFDYLYGGHASTSVLSDSGEKVEVEVLAMRNRDILLFGSKVFCRHCHHSSYVAHNKCDCVD